MTLIEMMIVLAILAVLAAIALPSYEEVMMRARRSEAREALSDFAARQEQFFLDNKTKYAIMVLKKAFYLRSSYPNILPINHPQAGQALNCALG